MIAGAAAAVIVIVVLVAVAVPALTKSAVEEPAGPAAKVSFLAVGDNLPDDYIGWYADGLSGESGDGVYDYAPLYEPIAEYVKEADLSYIDQEVHLGGDDIGPQGYPSFNATDSMADTLVDLGFDFAISCNMIMQGSFFSGAS